MEWQPIASVPKNGKPIDLWHSDFGRMPDCFWQDWSAQGSGWITPGGYIPSSDGFTHWMKVEPPK